MSNLQPFPHRKNPDGTIDSICNRCYKTVATSKDEKKLAEYEASHLCKGMTFTTMRFPNPPRRSSRFG